MRLVLHYTDTQFSILLQLKLTMQRAVTMSTQCSIFMVAFRCNLAASNPHAAARKPTIARSLAAEVA